MFKKNEVNNEGLNQVKKQLSKSTSYNKQAISNVIDIAKDILTENTSHVYTQQHPIFNYLKIFTDDIQNQLAIDLLKNGGDYISNQKIERYDIVDAYYHSIDKILFKDLYEKSKSYDIEDLNVLNGKSPMITKIWNTKRIANNIKGIGRGFMEKIYYNNGIEKENAFNYSSINHMAKYFYPLGVTMVYNGNHSIFSGMNKSEGEIKVKELYDVSYLYDIFYFDGKYLINKETREKHQIYFEIGAIFEIGRLLIDRPEVFDSNIQTILT